MSAEVAVQSSDPERSWGFEEGDEIVSDRYVVRLLGGGRAYEAYLAWDDTLHALVVAKMLRPHLVGERAATAALEREAEALARLAHPSIVRAFDSVLTGHRPHLVLEFSDGPRLSTLIRRYGVIVEQLLALALELCSALHYMRVRSVVHLDVKPRNVVMSAPPKLIDLSVARRQEEVRELRSPVGTDAYMAPEQCEAALFSQIGPASDVWGLGVTLYEALGRALPFSRRRDQERHPQLDEDPAPLPADVPPALADVIFSCLDKEPANRPTARELAATLEPWVAGLPRPRLGRFRPGGRVRRGYFQTG